jgi:hypothetical protein
MAMTKKDYEALARALRNAAPAPAMPQMWASGCDSARQFIARRVVEYARSRDVKFDRARFLRLAGIDEELSE